MTPEAAAVEAPTVEQPPIQDAPKSFSAFMSNLSSAPEVMETARIIVPREDLNDEAFAAVKRGDAQKLKSLLESGLDGGAKDADGVSLLDRAVERFKDLSRAVDEGETEKSQEEQLKKVDPEARADAGLAALVLAGANGNVDVAQMILNEMDDDALSDENDDIAEEIALEHGNMSVFLAILARKQRMDFNHAANDVHSEEREANWKDNSGQTFGEWFNANYHSFSHAIREEAHSVGQAFSRAAHRVGSATSNACHAVMDFCSTFFHHQSEEPAEPPETPEAKAYRQQLEKEMAPAVAFLNRLFHFDNSNKP